MLYELAKPFLFKMEPERAHRLAMKALKMTTPWVSNQMYYKPVSVMGLNFPNRVGLAAGFDKNGEVFEALFKCGFGFVEVGTLTPKGQVGNPTPRLFRLSEDKAIINRMGFNNRGVDGFLKDYKKQSKLGILGINIGKNKETSDSETISDYRIAYEKVYDAADYVTINVSSPNTPGLRLFESGDELIKLLRALQAERKRHEDYFQKRVPLVLKISPDLADEDLKLTAQAILEYGLDGVIATNTTLSRDDLTHSLKREQGGLSGAPLTSRSTQVVSKLATLMQGAVPIIAAGGIGSEAEAKEKLEAGASLVQIYTGFIYQGPKLISKLVRTLS